MRLLNASEFQTQPIFSCDDLIRQWSFFNKQPLESLMSEHLHLKEAEAVKESIQKQLKEKLVEKVRPWFQKKERKKMKNERFPKEIFVHHFQKLKNVFGHKSLDEDFEDYDYLTSPIYNLLYDKTGKIIVTADDDG